MHIQVWDETARENRGIYAKLIQTDSDGNPKVVEARPWTAMALGAYLHGNQKYLTGWTNQLQMVKVRIR